MAGVPRINNRNLTVFEEKKDPYIEHLEKTRAQVREELLVRMKQRDTYSVEMIAILGGLVGLTYAIKDQAYNHIIIPVILIIAPAMAIYFTKLIMYSYEVSIALGKYMKEMIEPEFAVKFYDDMRVVYKNVSKDTLIEQLSHIQHDNVRGFYKKKQELLGEITRMEWENYRDTVMYRGVRKQFFLYVMMAVYFFDIVFCVLGIHYSTDKLYYIVAYVICTLYIFPIYILFDSKEEQRFKEINEKYENYQTTKLIIKKTLAWLTSELNYARVVCATALVLISLAIVFYIDDIIKFALNNSGGLMVFPIQLPDVGVNVLLAIIATLAMVFFILLSFILFKK